MRSEWIQVSDGSDYGIMMIMPNEESDWVHQVFRYIHSPALFIQRDNSDFKGKKREGVLKMAWTNWKFNLPIWQKGSLVI